jgi:hypothetical protein
VFQSGTEAQVVVLKEQLREVIAAKLSATEAAANVLSLETLDIV